MTCPRHEIVDNTQISTYHCISRCVRKAFLCGKDPLSGKSFEHRREWIRNRLSALVNIFAVQVISYCIMHNHLHCLITIRPDIAQTWSPTDIAMKWRSLFPLKKSNSASEQPTDEEIQAISTNSELVELYRQRLSNVSWFNKCLNENIARRANKEDDCKGRFWESRFKCQRVSDIRAIISCSTYIDLNPIRAGIAQTPEDSDYTSIQDRISAQTEPFSQRINTESMIPLVPITTVTNGQLSELDYIALLDSTGRYIQNKKGSIPSELPPILLRLKINPDNWLSTSTKLNSLFRRLIAPVKDIIAAAALKNKPFFHGIRAARLCFM